MQPDLFDGLDPPAFPLGPDFLSMHGIASTRELRYWITLRTRRQRTRP
ncbi:MAG TPA: hypothetical protein VFP68_24145 [Burkholderiaceae bacterium]|nr:hypothetical protein [Burkholderiaceae bacterium]